MTWVLRVLRMKYCKCMGACVEEFDYYCKGLYTAIGKGGSTSFPAKKLHFCNNKLS